MGVIETSLKIFKDKNLTIPATTEDTFVAPQKIFALAEFEGQNSFELQLRRCWATPRFFNKIINFDKRSHAPSRHKDLR